MGVVTGLEFEAELARAAGLTARATGPEGVVSAVAGLAVGGADALVSFGVAGGLDPALRTGDLVVATEIVGAEGPWPTDEALRADLNARLPDARTGPLYAARRPLASRADKAATFAATGALAVDMESAAIAGRARALGLPFAAVRAVLDPAELSLPAAALAGFGPAGRIAWGPLFRALLREPFSLPGLVDLARRMGPGKAALRRAAAVLGTMARPAG